MKIGIIKEGKTPPDRRVPLSPKQCKYISELYPELDIQVQKSPIRAFSDSEYQKEGLVLVDNLNECDVIFGVKEVNIEDLIPNKHFFFFSHTIKKQPYNRDLLNAVLDKKIQLTDYEVLTEENGSRLIGFGRYAGIVGCYNAFLTYGLKSQRYELKPAHRCEDRKELEREVQKIDLPSDFKLVLSGFGRVGHGAREILSLISIDEVSAGDFLDGEHQTPVFTQLNVDDYNKRADGAPFDRSAFYKDGSGHISTFDRYLTISDMYIPCHFWKDGAPYIFTREDLKNSDVRLKVVADISCDIDGPIASTLRPSTIADPIYGYDPISEKEVDFRNDNAIAVMAVDNLPCELPKDASEDFGNELIRHILPCLLGDDPTEVIARATETTKDGELSPFFSYLQDYVDGKE